MAACRSLFLEILVGCITCTAYSIDYEMAVSATPQMSRQVSEVVYEYGL